MSLTGTVPIPHSGKSAFRPIYQSSLHCTYRSNPTLGQIGVPTPIGCALYLPAISFQSHTRANRRSDFSLRHDRRRPDNCSNPTLGQIGVPTLNRVRILGCHFPRSNPTLGQIGVPTPYAE